MYFVQFVSKYVGLYRIYMLHLNYNCEIDKIQKKKKRVSVNEFKKEYIRLP